MKTGYGSGRPRKAIELTVVDGHGRDVVGHRRARETKRVIPSAKAPRPPAHLDKIARIAWRRLAPILFKNGLLNDIDRDALAAYCVVYARWVEAEKQVKALGPIVKTKTGAVMHNPWLSVANKCLEQMNSFMIKFGMSPADRARVKGDSETGAGDGMSELLSG